MTGTYVERNHMLTDKFAPEGMEKTHRFNDEPLAHESLEALQCEQPIGDGSQGSDHEFSRWKPFAADFTKAQARFLKPSQPARV